MLSCLSTRMNGSPPTAEKSASVLCPNVAAGGGVPGVGVGVGVAVGVGGGVGVGVGGGVGVGVAVGVGVGVGGGVGSTPSTSTMKWAVLPLTLPRESVTTSFTSYSPLSVNVW